MKRDIFIFDQAKGRSVKAGTMFNQCYTKHMPPRNIMQRVFPGSVGISEDVIKQLEKVDCKYIAITVQGLEHVYMSTILQWTEAFTGKADFGHGPQVFLDLNAMRVSALSGFDPTKAEVLYAQAKP